MAIALHYRKHLSINELEPHMAESDHVLGRPLTMLEIDANMKTIDLAFDKNEDDHTAIYKEIAKKAPINYPILRGFVGLPTYKSKKLLPTTYVGEGSSSQPVPVGALAFDNETKGVMLRVDQGAEGWVAVSTEKTMGDYVCRTGDDMTGPLTGTTSTWSNTIKALPPDGEVGVTEVDTVATVGWAKKTITDMIDNRLNGGGEGSNNIIINKGDLIVNKGNIIVDGTITANRLQGDLDCGVL